MRFHLCIKVKPVAIAGTLSSLYCSEYFTDAIFRRRKMVSNSRPYAPTLFGTHTLLQRCDAVKPVCGPCSRSTGAFSDCEYTDLGLTKTQQLEDQIAVLEARIEHLQTSGEGSVTLHSPYRGQRGKWRRCPSGEPTYWHRGNSASHPGTESWDRNYAFDCWSSLGSKWRWDVS